MNEEMFAINDDADASYHDADTSFYDVHSKQVLLNLKTNYADAGLYIAVSCFVNLNVLH